MRLSGETNKPWVAISILPPLPSKALAVMLLPSSKVRVSLSMVMLPPLPLPPASAAIVPPRRKIVASPTFRTTSPPCPEALEAVSSPSLTKIESALICSVPPLPAPALSVATRPLSCTRSTGVSMVTFPASPVSTIPGGTRESSNESAAELMSLGPKTFSPVTVTDSVALMLMLPAFPCPIVDVDISKSSTTSRPVFTIIRPPSPRVIVPFRIPPRKTGPRPVSSTDSLALMMISPEFPVASAAGTPRLPAKI
ncbi:hypothetical protein CKA32_003268 [Geitlerinema sp. FC II]|nr:hypothetical protein CKA32_003268 [Geitlerinema sp. FC II]